MDLRLLGPVEIVTGKQHLDVGPPQRRAVLAILAAKAGAHVPTDVLVDRVWGDDPPRTARRVLHSHLSRLRRLVGRACDYGAMCLVRRGDGYVLNIETETVDLHRFRRLVERAHASSCTAAERVILLSHALSLYRGEPLAGLATEWAFSMRAALQRERLDATVAWAQAEAATSNHPLVISTLSELVAEYPLEERLVAALMHALLATGYCARALELYALTRRKLSDALGVDPSSELQELHRLLLTSVV
jgi:DNA-binding SARP family transcriptional activator